MTKPKYATCDSRFWWKKNKWDTFDVFWDTYKEAKERLEDGDYIIVKVKGNKLIPITKKPKLTTLDKDQTKALIYDVATKHLVESEQNTNDLYIAILRKIFTEHTIFDEINFIDVLCEYFTLDDKGYWAHKTT